jgi:glycosyltransferase involved in cell wall biosynthesis
MKRTSPRISIVTAVFNNLPGLEVTVESIAAQTYRNVEHVVVDGRSSDGTLEYLGAYSPDYSVVWSSEPDSGIYDAMNTGIQRASGDLVLFLNGGDSLSDKHVLDEVARAWEEGDWVWGYGTLRYVDDSRAQLRTFSHTPFSRRKVSLGLSFVPHPTTYVALEMVRKLGGFRLEFGFSADQEFATRLSAHSAPHIWNYVMADYLVGGAHFSSGYMDTSRRYRLIRRRNEMLVGGSSFVDALYTTGLGWYWSFRATASSRLKRVAR